MRLLPTSTMLSMSTESDPASLSSGRISTVSPARPRLRAITHGRRRAGDGGSSRPAASARSAGPPRRARIVQRDDEIGARRGLQAGADRLPRGQQIRQRDRAEIVAERRAGPRRRGLHRADPGRDHDLDRRPVAAPLALDQLEDQRREAVDAGIARRHQRDRPALGRQIERQPRPRRLLADRAVVPALAGDRSAEQVEIEAVADDFVGRRKQRGGLRGAPSRIAGADADDRQPAARPADRAGVDRRRRRARSRRSRGATGGAARPARRPVRQRRAPRPRPPPSSRSRETPPRSGSSAVRFRRAAATPERTAPARRAHPREHGWPARRP